MAASLVLTAGVFVQLTLHSNSESEQQYPETSTESYWVGAVLRASMTCVIFLQRALFPTDLRAHYTYHQEHLYYLLQGMDLGWIPQRSSR